MTEEQLTEGMAIAYELKALKEKQVELQKVYERAGEISFNIEFSVRGRDTKEASIFPNLKAVGATYEEAYKVIGGRDTNTYKSSNEAFAVIAKTTLGMIIETLKKEIVDLEAKFNAV